MDVNERILHMAENGACPTVDYPTTQTGWEELTLLPAQLERFPLFSPAEAVTATVIGKSATVPLRLSAPLIISHMSVGALSPELKCALARAASEAGVAIGGGDGGVLWDELELSSAYIYEYTPGLWGLTPQVLERCGAVEIKIGQGCGGGMPFTVPEGADVLAYRLRGGEEGRFFTTPGRFSDMNTPSDLRLMISGLREGCGGKPVGVKIAAGRVEADLDVIIEAGADFVTIDGGKSGWRGAEHLSGGLSAPEALSCAVRHLERRGRELDIIIAGGIRTPEDAAKGLAMGATAVAAASAVLTAACGSVTGASPFSPDETAARAANYLRAMTDGIRDICAYAGRSSAAQLDRSDLAPVRPIKFCEK